MPRLGLGLQPLRYGDAYARLVRDMFANGEQGGWYDPADLSTLFQDAGGTTPVTALGQPVGLILDKSRGLARGPELFANQVGTLNNAAGGATANYAAATQTIAISAAGTNSEFPRLSIDVGMVVGRVYAVSGAVTGNPNGMARVRLALSGFANDLSYSRATGQIRGTVVAASSSIEFLVDGTVTGTLSISSLSVREVLGNHLTQTTGTSRPLWQQDGTTGAYFLQFDGLDDFLTCATFNMSASDKVAVCAGVRKLSDAASATVVELSSASSANTGSFSLFSPLTALPNHAFLSRGDSATPSQAVSASSFVSPITNVVTGIGDISGDVSRVFVDGIQSGQSLADQGTGNYGAAYPLFVGRRAGTSLPLNGRLHGLVIRGGAITDAQRQSLERFMASRTGVAL